MPETVKITNSSCLTIVGLYNKDFNLLKEYKDIEQTLVDLRKHNGGRMQVPSIRRLRDRVKYACEERGIDYESFRKAIGLDFPNKSGGQMVWGACPICPSGLRETAGKDDGSCRAITPATHCLTTRHLCAIAAYLWVDPKSLGVQQKCPVEGCKRWFSRNKTTIIKHVRQTHSTEYWVSEDVDSDTDDYYICSRGPTHLEGQEDQFRNGGSHAAKQYAQPSLSPFGSASGSTTKADKSAIRTEGPSRVRGASSSDRLPDPSPKPLNYQLVIARLLARLPDFVSVIVLEDTYRIEDNEGYFEFDKTDAKFLGFLESIMDFLDAPSGRTWFQNFDFSRLKPRSEVSSNSRALDTIGHSAQSLAHLLNVSQAQKKAVAQPTTGSPPLRPFGGNTPSKSSPTRKVSAAANAADKLAHRNVLPKRKSVVSESAQMQPRAHESRYVPNQESFRKICSSLQQQGLLLSDEHNYFNSDIPVSHLRTVVPDE